MVRASDDICFSCPLWSSVYECHSEVILVPYMDAVVAVTVMRVLLIVLRVCMLRV